MLANVRSGETQLFISYRYLLSFSSFHLAESADWFFVANALEVVKRGVVSDGKWITMITCLINTRCRLKNEVCG